MKSSARVACAAGLAVLLSGVHAIAEGSADARRDVFNKTKASVIRVSAMLKMDMRESGLPIQLGGMGDREIETCATVIAPDGLSVTSYITLNPLSLLGNGLKIRVNDEDMNLKPKTDITQIKYHMPDGTEVPARMVYKDQDLDIVFLMPDLKDGAKAPKFDVMEVKDGATVRELDSIMVIGRLTKELSRTACVSEGQVTAVVAKPRLMYDLAIGGQVTVGCPVFNAEGQLVGFTLVLSKNQDESTEASAMMQLGAQVIVLPAGEVKGLVDAARKAAEKKDKDTDSKADSKPESK
jgi:hypothetical protein